MGMHINHCFKSVVTFVALEWSIPVNSSKMLSGGTQTVLFDLTKTTAKNPTIMGGSNMFFEFVPSTKRLVTMPTE